MTSLSFKEFLFESIALNESFTAAQKVFSKTNDPTKVKDTLDRFKSLNQQNKIKPEHKDITKWMNKPFKDLQDFVAQIESTPSNKQLKKTSKKDAIRLAEWGDWIAIIPLTTEASCQYGSNTKWCTAATDSKNFFNDYFNNANVTLVYFINRKNNTKYATALYSIEDIVECFDSSDNSISKDALIKVLGLTIEKFDTIVYDAKKHDKVHDTRANTRLTKKAEEYLKLQVNYTTMSEIWSKKKAKELSEFIDDNKNKLDDKTLLGLKNKLEEMQKFIQRLEEESTNRNKQIKASQIFNILCDDIDALKFYSSYASDELSYAIERAIKHIDIAKKYTSYDSRIDDLINQIQRNYIDKQK